ncbi:MAG: ribbon-helix-helix domain-containing protein [Acidimicrobiales bacterium]
MRTTVTFDQDIAAAVDRLRRQEHPGVSAVVNDLIRRGLAEPQAFPRFHQMSTAMGAPKVPLDGIGGALTLLEQPPALCEYELQGSDRRHRVRLGGARLDLRIDVSNVGEALEIAEGPDRR